MCMVCGVEACEITAGDVLEKMAESITTAQDKMKELSPLEQAEYMTGFFGTLFKVCILHGPAFHRAAEIERARIASSN